MKCLECGESFTPLSVTQLYCSSKCGQAYRRKHKRNYPSITFRCAKCGKVVVTENGSRDMRTRFCSAECEKKFWRHPPHESDVNNTTFSSLGMLKAWESMTNK